MNDSYITEACSHGFQCLYDNIGGAVESMGNWSVAFVLFSYEIINAPWTGNYLVNPTLLLPGIAGVIYLQPFYEKIAKAIRSVGNELLFSISL